MSTVLLTVHQSFECFANKQGMVPGKPDYGWLPHNCPIWAAAGEVTVVTGHFCLFLIRIGAY